MSKIYILMGVSGCGKSTIGERLSKKVGLPFVDADDFHSKENKIKMSEGIPLTDVDRKPWLTSVNLKLKELQLKGAILACSALKESCRELLSANIKNINWVYLQGDYDIIEKRLKRRASHFFNPDLLQSQFDCLEEPRYGVRISIALNPDRILDYIINKNE